jgi:TorA maturation chaperone TorD
VNATVAAPVSLHRALPPEEAARGDFYALIARMLRGAPDDSLLESLATAPALPPEGDGALAKAWQDLAHASSAMDSDAAAEEYENLFVGVGKSEVSLFAGYYGGAPSIDHPRVRLQADLAALGLERRPEVTEPEDHFAGLFEVMRVLAAGGAGRSPAPLGEQKRFFEAHIAPGAARCFAAIGSAPHANYYRHVAALGRAFVALESESFVLD